MTISSRLHRWWKLWLGLLAILLTGCPASEEPTAEAAGQVLVRLSDSDEVMAVAGGHLLVLEGLDQSVGWMFTLHLPDPVASPNTLVLHDQAEWFRPLHQVFIRDDVPFRGWYALTAGPSYAYQDSDADPAFGDPGQLLAVATLPEFRIEHGVSQEVEAALSSPAGELDFLTEDQPNIIGWRADEMAIEHWQNGPMPSSISVLVQQ
jgi:hypothetical protein